MNSLIVPSLLFYYGVFLSVCGIASVTLIGWKAKTALVSGGFEATISYRFIPRLAAYAGWGWNTFGPQQSDNSVAHFEETGYRFGLQFIQPLNTESKLNILLSAGGVGNHIETENEQGDIVNDTGHGLGWEIDAALSIPLNDRWQIIPGIRYHALSREMTNGTVKESVELNYLSVGIGVSWTLVGH